MTQHIEYCTCPNHDSQPRTEHYHPSLPSSPKPSLVQTFSSFRRNNSSPRLLEPLHKHSSPSPNSTSSTLFTRTLPNSDSISTFKQSWSKYIHRPKMNCSVGMKRKPLLAYDANHERSRLRVMLKVEKARSNKKNTFDNFDFIKNRTIIRTTFETMYQKSFKHPEALRRLKLKEQMID